LLERVRSLRTVQSAASVAVVPLSGSLWNGHISIPELSVTRQLADFNQISDKYFETVGTRLIAGRDFNHTDDVNSPLVAIVTQKFVNQFLKGKNPIGTYFRAIQQAGEPDLVYQIVGLVNDVKYTDLREEFTPIVFVAESQSKLPEEYSAIVVRSNEDLGVLTASIRNLLRGINPSIVVEFQPFRSLVRQGLLRERLMATLSGFFGLLAAILAMIGLYGVISYMVVRRRNEIGIRMALGADRSSILSMILREATTLLIAGLALGTFLALITGSAARALLFGLQPNDPATIGLSILGLAAIAFLASLLPAQRAAALNPTQALHEE
jgi:putative ABC transport system permease protein